MEVIELKKKDLDVEWKRAVVDIANEFRKSNKLKGLEIEDVLRKKLDSVDASEAEKRALLESILGR